MKIEKPNLTLKDIQIDVGGKEFEKALAIYREKKIDDLQENSYGYSAKIKGTSVYNVSIDRYSYARGDCNCYLGQKDILCKHMIALAIAVVYRYNPDDIDLIDIPLDQAVCSGEVREITEYEIQTFNGEIKMALAYLKGYRGPSSRWFEYQDSLIKGSRLTLLAIAKLPVCEKSILLCASLLKRLDKKLSSVVDDSDGTVGNLVYEVTEVLSMFVEENKNLKPFILKNLPKSDFYNFARDFPSLQ